MGGKHEHNCTREIKYKPLWQHKGGSYCLGKEMSQAFLGRPLNIHEESVAVQMMQEMVDLMKVQEEALRRRMGQDLVIYQMWWSSDGGEGQFLAWVTGLIGLLTLPDTKNTGGDCSERKVSFSFQT